MQLDRRREMLVTRGNTSQGRPLSLFGFVNEETWCVLVLEAMGGLS